ncbi:MarR family EPS-associated transcriptional regulator [Rhodoferax ferrireducens]|uniref:MarR family EPS-associated transcriptional regulator n=1 Tax=Rhodoferax ferrireducens TaxID=192843 RepID=UPI00298E1149|nr:MarR family EPS-associated transcriptional regulator [Rhodoferax ferrireducens]WPC68104.1 MarR family EPS-associated transcriptional regulator [Rhodoferax ferrireducens]
MTAIAPFVAANVDASAADQALHLEIHFKVMGLLQAKPDMSQRQMAKALGLSLGKTNYCVQALLKKGWLKLQNFSGNANKQAYAYLLTPEGIANKAQLTTRFLQRKQQEYVLLKAEIEALQREASSALQSHQTQP